MTLDEGVQLSFGGRRVVMGPVQVPHPYHSEHAEAHEQHEEMKRHRYPLRLQSGYWVADWKLKKDLEVMSSVLLGKLNYPPPIAAVPPGRIIHRIQELYPEIAFHVSKAYAHTGKDRRTFLVVVLFTFSGKISFSESIAAHPLRRKAVVCALMSGFLFPRCRCS